MMCSVTKRSLGRIAALEHPEHSVGDDEAAHDVAGGGNHGDGPQHSGERALMFADQHDRPHHGDRVEGVGQRHQRRVQQRRHAPNHLEIQ